MLLKAKNVDATEGPILKKIIIYAIPLILSTLIQTLFNAVDMIVLGNMADSVAVAAVGATTAITGLIVNSFVGLANGTKIILARLFGAKDGKHIREISDTSLITGLIIGLAVAILGIALAPWFLARTNCPDDCFSGAVIYIRIYVTAAPAIMVYNFGSSILVASGDTQRPLYYIIIAGLLNVILNILLCLILPEKVAAVAIATVASQVLGALLVTIRLCRIEGLGRLEIRKMKFSVMSFWQILRFGLPLALNQALYPISSLQIQSAINSYGVAATAGNSAGATIEGFASAFTGPIGTSAATFMGQNIGKGSKERVQKSFLHCLWLATLVSGTFGMIFYLLGKPLLLPLIVGNDEAAIAFGNTRMFFVCSFYWIAGLNSVLGSAIQAYGHSLNTALNSIICVFAFRFLWMWFVYPLHTTFEWLIACYTVSWSLLLVFNIVSYIVARIRFNKNSYHSIY